MNISDTVIIDAPATTVTSPFSISGKATPGAKVVVYEPGGAVRYDDDNLYADPNGNWSIPQVTKPDGSYMVCSQQSLNGQTSPWSPIQYYNVQPPKSSVQPNTGTPGPNIDYDSLLKNEIFNTANKKENYVDPRTGLFNAYFPIASLIANAAQGPNLDIDLFYRPNKSNRLGVGLGWGLRLSSYDILRKTLTLSTGVSIDNPISMSAEEVLKSLIPESNSG